MSYSAHHHNKTYQRRTAGRCAWIAVLMVLALVPSGCVRRRLMVRSNPSDALVYVDNQQIGKTPCSVDFTYYGTREIRLVKPGYETLTVNQPIPTPWYEVPPLDFFSENLAMHEIHDNRTVSYNLVPQVIVPTQQLLDRANQLRQETLQAPVAPAAATEPAGILPAPPGYPTNAAPTTPTPYTGPAPMYGPTTAPSVTTPLASPQLPASRPAAAPLPQQGQPLVSPPLR